MNKMAFPTLTCYNHVYSQYMCFENHCISFPHPHSASDFDINKELSQRQEKFVRSLLLFLIAPLLILIHVFSSINRVFNYDCHLLTFPPNYNYPVKVRVPKEGTYTANMCQIILQAEKLTKNE